MRIQVGNTLWFIRWTTVNFKVYRLGKPKIVRSANTEDCVSFRTILHKAFSLTKVMIFILFIIYMQYSLILSQIDKSRHF